MKVKFVDLPEVVLHNIWEDVASGGEVAISQRAKRLFAVTGIKRYYQAESVIYEFENKSHYVMTLLKYS